MRSGHYKLSCSKSSGDASFKGISSGQFKTTYKELPPLSTFSRKQQDSVVPVAGPELCQLSALSLIKVQQDVNQKRLDKQITMEVARVLRHRSCENINAFASHVLKTGVVEQKVRSLLMKNETRKRPDLPLFDSSSVRSSCDVWQAGKIVTKRHRISAAHSHSALHTLGGGSSDTASCMSASSGYSSSNSSSYGSFKSCGSVNSSLQRQRNNSTGSSSPGSDTGRVLFVDNPLYDITPAAAARLYDVSRSYENSLLESLSSGEFSLGDVCNLPEEVEEEEEEEEVVEEDPVAKECRDYFEKRLRTSETLRKRWSISLSRPKTKYSDSDLISKGDAIIDSRLNPDLTSTLDSGVGVESNAMPLDDDLEEFSQDSLEYYIANPVEEISKKKTPLDEKMEFLRQEIASLMQQDNTLFKQLLSLNESISTLKIRNSFGHQPMRPLTPSSLDSFTEEEEDFAEDLQVLSEEVKRPEQQKEQSTKETQDEIKLTDPSGELNCRRTTKDDEVEIVDDEEDEGHCTDLSLGPSPNSSPTHSPSPSSTLSSKGSSSSSYSRSFSKSSFENSSSASFIRCRKSYAPNARNRRRASSVTGPKSPQIISGSTTALVVIHTDEDLSFLNPSRARPNAASFTTTTRSHDEGLVSTYLEASSNLILRSLSSHHHNSPPSSIAPSSSSSPSKKKMSLAKDVVKKSRSNGSSPRKKKEQQQTRSTSLSNRPNLTHPPYRESLIM